MLPFQLAIVPVDACRLHETSDPSRVRLIMNRIRRQRLFTNPIIVSRLGAREYLVLDGANRLTALRALRMPYVLVQIYQYDSDDVALHTWAHALEQGTFAVWQKQFGKLLHFRKVARLDVRAISDRCAAVFLAHRQTVWAGALPEDMKKKVDILHALVGVYKGKHPYHRLVVEPDTSFSTTTVVFPLFTKKDIKGR